MRTAYDLNKSLSFDKTVEITGHMHFRLICMEARKVLDRVTQGH